MGLYPSVFPLMLRRIEAKKARGDELGIIEESLMTIFEGLRKKFLDKGSSYEAASFIAERNVWTALYGDEPFLPMLQIWLAILTHTMNTKKCVQILYENNIDIPQNMLEFWAKIAAFFDLPSIPKHETEPGANNFETEDMRRADREREDIERALELSRMDQQTLDRVMEDSRIEFEADMSLRRAIARSKAEHEDTNPDSMDWEPEDQSNQTSQSSEPARQTSEGQPDGPASTQTSTTTQGGTAPSWSDVGLRRTQRRQQMLEEMRARYNEQESPAIEEIQREYGELEAETFLWTLDRFRGMPDHINAARSFHEWAR